MRIIFLCLFLAAQIRQGDFAETAELSLEFWCQTRNKDGEMNCKTKARKHGR